MNDAGGRGGLPGVTRRGWLAAAAAAAAAALGTRWAEAKGEDEKLRPEEEKARDEVLARAKEVGIGRLTPKVTRNFLAVGNAPAPFMTQALEICENLLADYLQFFQARKFPVRPPAQRLTLVILATPKQQIKFLGDDDPERSAWPVFDPDANRLVFFDLRAGGATARGKRERGNTVLICHETSLLIMENTGMVDPDGDVPRSVREGLAGLLENRPATGRRPPGRPNVGKLAQLSEAQGVSWISASRLLGEDQIFEDGATFSLADAESWVLVELLIRFPKRLPGFLGYLKASNARRDPARRLDDARAHLGDLDKLDKDLHAIADEWRAYYAKLPDEQKPRPQ